VNEALGLPLTIGLMGELVENKEVGCQVAADGFKGLLWTHLLRGVMPSNGFPGICCG
jgi:hypothetical protein